MSETPLPLCSKHGEHQEWSLRKPHGAHKTPYYRCKLCDRERCHASKQQPWRLEARRRAGAKERADVGNSRAKYRASVHAALLEQYGVVVAERYVLATATSRRVDVRALLRGIIAEAHPHLTANQLKRALKLNEIASQPLTNTVWRCAHCSIESSDVGFFDIDHVIPCAKLGKRSAKGNSNLQVLCPNCHRCKTLGLALWCEVEAQRAA
jgi:hypothetical protein